MVLYLWTLIIPEAVLVIITPRNCWPGRKTMGVTVRKLVQSPSPPRTSQVKFEEVM